MYVCKVGAELGIFVLGEGGVVALIYLSKQLPHTVTHIYTHTLFYYIYTYINTLFYLISYIYAHTQQQQKKVFSIKIMFDGDIS